MATNYPREMNLKVIRKESLHERRKHVQVKTTSYPRPDGDICDIDNNYLQLIS